MRSRIDHRKIRIANDHRFVFVDNPIRNNGNNLIVNNDLTTGNSHDRIPDRNYSSLNRITKLFECPPKNFSRFPKGFDRAS